jgi:hypothetical protein
VISFANLTYANMGAVNLQVLDTLVTLAGLKPRVVMVSRILQQRKRELSALLPEWRGAQESGIFAGNFWLDYFVDSLKKESEELFARAGKIIRVGEMEADNQLRGTFRLVGEKANIAVRFTLTPENPAKIQEFRIWLEEK